MKLPTLQKWWTTIAATASLSRHRSPPPQRGFRFDAALEAIAKASEDKVSTIDIYNYPSFSGAFSALFAHVFHSRLNVPCLILPFSSAVPLRSEKIWVENLERVYLLDFVGPRGFAEKILQRCSCKVIGFDHRKSAFCYVPSQKDCPKKLEFHVNVEKSSSVAAYEYFSAKLCEMEGSEANLIDPSDRDRVETVLKYIEDIDLRCQSLPDVKVFRIALDIWRSKLNCLVNPFVYEQVIVGMVFNFFVFRYKKQWWQRYNYVLSAALDAGVAFMAVLLYFSVGLEEKSLTWWGTDDEHCQFATCPTAKGIVVDGCPLN